MRLNAPEDSALHIHCVKRKTDTCIGDQKRTVEFKQCDWSKTRFFFSLPGKTSRRNVPQIEKDVESR